VADRRPGWRFGVTIVAALAAGVVLAWMDTRPSFDDTGVLAVLLFLAGATAAIVGRDRPWLWALLVGAPVPLAELAQGGSLASLTAVAFAAAGAVAGYLIARSFRATTA
jgi:hypothetical protein